MRIAVTGASGLFGHGLAQVFSSRHTVAALTHADVDITNAEQVREVVAGLRPDLVIHSAAIRDPDTAELNPARAFQVNFHGTRNVAEAARAVGAKVVCISSDAVFDGKQQRPYTETDPTIPASVYGRTKLRAEQWVMATPESWAFRVSILFGPEEPERGKARENFIRKGLRKIAAGEEYVVAADQLGTATYTLDAAAKIMEVVESGRYGLYHLSNAGACTRLELARYAATTAGLDPTKVVGKPLAEMGRPGPRLQYAVMAMNALHRAGFALPRPWQAALAEYVQSSGAGENVNNE
jgi:dTDP-4-dehydrorhamnose reductase